MPRDADDIYGDHGPTMGGYGGSPALSVEVDGWNAADIPPRDWIARGYLLRGAVTLVIGPGGVSKSTLMVAYAAALALGEPVQGMRPIGPMRTMLYNVEDDQDEQRRRLTAVLTSMGHEPADLAGRVARVMPTGVGTLLEPNPEPMRGGGSLRHTAAMNELVAAIEAERPDVLILDPLAELHGAEENANGLMREVAATFRRLAVTHRMAVVIVHHTRKGPADPGNPDSGRGASSVASAARVVLTVSTMDEAAAERLGVAPDQRHHYFRVDGGKSNYAALSSNAEWFERVAYEVGAGPDGVAVPVPWEPPSEAVSLDTRLAIERAVEQGSSVGPWSTRLSNDQRSIRNLLEQHGIRTPKGQRAMLDTLLANGFTDAAFRRPNRGTGAGLRSSTGAPTNVVWVNQ